MADGAHVRNCLKKGGDGTNYFSPPPIHLHRVGMVASLLCSLVLAVYRAFQNSVRALACELSHQCLAPLWQAASSSFGFEPPQAWGPLQAVASQESFPEHMGKFHPGVPSWSPPWMLGCDNDNLLKQLLCPSCGMKANPIGVFHIILHCSHSPACVQE